MAGIQIDGVNNKIDFDDDLDTSISANTDDTLVIEAGGNTMATITATTFTINDGTTITTADNTDTLTLKSTDADANSGPNLRLYRNSSSPADADTIGVVEFEGRNDNSEDVIYSQMRTVVNDVSDGTEDGQIDIKIMNGGSLNMVASFKGTETVINDASIDHDFRVESNGNANMLFVDGGNNNVGIGTGSPGTETTLHLNNTSTVLKIEGASANNAYIDFTAANTWTIGTNTGAGVNDNSFGIVDGSNIAIECSTSEVIINQNSQDIDFRVEGNGDTHLIFADAGDDDVYIGYYTGGDNDDAMLFVATDQNKEVAKLTAANGSYGEDVIHLDCTRAGSTNYNLIRATSNGNNDSELVLNGAGALSIDGTLTENGADYAEYFEWNDGNSSDEDRVGLSVKLSGNKIVASSSSDDAADIIGVISGNPAVVGDASWNTWNDKYEKDDYGRYVWEDYTVTEWTELADTLGGGEQTLQTKSYQTDKIPDGVTAPDADVTVDGVLTKTAKVIISKGAGGENLSRKKESSSWDATATYVPRAERKEWDAVGLVGKLRMKKGQKTGTNWIKMRDISDTVEEWLVR